MLELSAAEDQNGHREQRREEVFHAAHTAQQHAGRQPVGRHSDQSKPACGVGGTPVLADEGYQAGEEDHQVGHGQEQSIAHYQRKYQPGDAQDDHAGQRDIDGSNGDQFLEFIRRSEYSQLFISTIIESRN